MKKYLCLLRSLREWGVNFKYVVYLKRYQQQNLNFMVDKPKAIINPMFFHQLNKLNLIVEYTILKMP